MDYLHRYDSPLGPITLASDGEALVGLWFDGQRYFGQGLSPEQSWQPLAVFDEAERWLSLYFSGGRPAFTPPLRLRGTPFRRRVWALLREIPYGEVATYGELAQTLGSSARAVGSAVGHNPVSLLVPCHRVVGAHGELTGYAGGLERKGWLLTLENANIDRFFLPRESGA